MAHLIFRLRGVPDDEAEDIRQLLTSQKVDFYETDAGNWGISMPGFWLNDDNDVASIKSLIEDYQSERAKAQRARYLEEVESGQHRTLLGVIKERPFASLGIIAFCAAIIYFSVKPFLTLIELTR